MSRTVISGENLSKEYVIGGRDHGNQNFREMITSAIVAPFRRLRRLSGKVIPEERIWALKNVSFEVQEGEVLGIIGRNGAGKSTLLKILSRITAPTEGRIEIRGRVSSLLEVGTGFHPELTGRENIYLNGAILGMSRAEIGRKFDEIVNFSGVERFLDTPVKRYSSGMSVRLAFAVAAHLEPEILIVDEVLAVGDAEFQKKCLGKMRDVHHSGRTVLFVSHNLDAIETLCGRAILLEGGQLKCAAPASEAIADYLGRGVARGVATFTASPDKPTIVRVEVDEVQLLNGALIVNIEFASPHVISPVIPGLGLFDEGGRPIYGSNARMHLQEHAPRSLSSGVIRFEAHDLPIREGKYVLSLWLSDWHQDYDHKPDVLLLNFRPKHPPARRSGPNFPVNWLARWQVESSWQNLCETQARHAFLSAGKS